MSIRQGLFFFLLLGTIIFSFVWVLLWNGVGLKVPSYEAIHDYKLPEASEIYSADSVLLGKIYVENRRSIDLSEIPDTLIHCLLATEDIRFFDHNGIDLIGLARVGIKTLLLGEKTGGGSTLTQQLVKNRYPRNSFSYENIVLHKIREWITALKLEQRHTKKQLLTQYFNTVPFGHNRFGIYTASQFYFDKKPEQLRVWEMATLVGLLKGTTLYDPLRNPERSLERRNLVLANMHAQGFLRADQLKKAQSEPLRVADQKEVQNPLAPFFVQHIKLKVEELLLAQHPKGDLGFDPYTDGLTIYTTLNAQLQHYAEKALRDHLDSLQERFTAEWDEERWKESTSLLLQLLKVKQYTGYESICKALESNATLTSTQRDRLEAMKSDLTRLHAGFACIANTGEVLAWVGGRDFIYSQYDHVKSKRQVGSVFKPIVYATAVDQGVNICNYFPNNKRIYSSFDDWEPRNASNYYSGAYTMKGALTFSLNVISVQVLFRAGLSDVLNVANQMGISTPLPQVPSISLGTPDISLYEMVNAYTCFPNEGKRVHTHYLESIYLPGGSVLYQKEAKATKEIFSQEVAAIMTNMMESVVNLGTGKALRKDYHLEGRIAGKTGTTQNQADGWFIGYTPHLTAGAWVGADNPGIHFKSIKQGAGSKTALPIWAGFARYVAEDSTYAPLLEGAFSQPSQRALNCLNQAFYKETIE